MKLLRRMKILEIEHSKMTKKKIKKIENLKNGIGG